jgi:hypothetical protein
MADFPKILFQSEPTVATDVTAYTAPSGGAADRHVIITTVSIANYSGVPVRANLAVVASGQALAAKNYLYKEIVVPGNDTLLVVKAITLGPGDFIVVRSSGTGLVFNGFGMEISGAIGQAEVPKILGQFAHSSGQLSTYQTLYEVPTAKNTMTATLIVCNTGGPSATFNIAIVRSPDGAVINKHLVYSNITIEGNDTFGVAGGFHMTAGDKIWVWSNSTSLAFHAYGTELG